MSHSNLFDRSNISFKESSIGSILYYTELINYFQTILLTAIV